MTDRKNTGAYRYLVGPEERKTSKALREEGETEPDQPRRRAGSEESSGPRCYEKSSVRSLRLGPPDLDPLC